MICKVCGKNNAEIYYKQTVNGHTEEYALCSECAEKLQSSGKINIKMPSLFDDFGFGFANDGVYGLKELLGFSNDTKLNKIAEKKKCTLCGSTFDELVTNGKVGCSKCYEVFEKELQNSIERIHGRTGYAGKIHEKHKTQETAEDKLCELKKELDEAITLQEFEKAAVLRDKIREMESKEN